MPDIQEYDILPSGEAQALVDNKVLNECLDQMEAEAIERGIHAHTDDDILRLVSTLEVKAIRELRSQLISRAAGKAKVRARAGAP